eukprot:m.111447 g.111447  ORF g.111447 m.111447 type:complete len:279 (+) comp22780_c0_seq1:85-921(+)
MGDIGERVVITGASSGLGRHLALAYAARKAILVISARRARLLEEVKFECMQAGATAVYCVPTDVTKESDCKNLADRARHHLPQSQIDVLILNAGRGMRGNVEDIKDTQIIHEMINTNTLGKVLTAFYCLPLVQAANGQIIVINSVSGLFGLPGLAPYCMSKHALVGFFDALRNEGVKVTMAMPGFMDTDMPAKNLDVNGKPVGHQDGMHRGTPWDPAYVAATVIEAADNNQRDVVFDMPIKIGLLFRHLIPSFLDRLIRQRFVLKKPEHDDVVVRSKL